MSWEDREDTTIYKVVVNHEEQYSIWPAHRENPLGWNDVGKTGPKAECLAYIKEVWTDMRPLSLRKKMEEMERSRQAEEAANGPSAPAGSPSDNRTREPVSACSASPTPEVAPRPTAAGARCCSD